MCHAAEDVVLESPPSQYTDLLLNVKDWVRRAFDFYCGKGEAPEGPDALLNQLRELLGDIDDGQQQSVTPGVIFFDEEDASASEEPPESSNKEDEATAVPPEHHDSQMPAAAPTEAGGTEDEASPEGMPLTGDKELIGEFIIEASEHLETADLQLLTLETDTENESAINAIFRAFHTIKGVSGFLDLHEIGALAHEAENLLDQARKKVFVLEGARIDLVFDAVDMLKQGIGRIKYALENNDLLAPTPGLLHLSQRLKAASAPDFNQVEEQSVSSSATEAKLGELLVNMGAANPEDIEDALHRQQQPPAPRMIGEVLRQESVVSSQQIEEALSLQMAEGAGLKTGEILVEMGRISEQELEQALDHQQAPPKPPKLGEVLVSEGRVKARDVAQALRAQAAPTKGEAVQVREAVKVDTMRLDLLIDTIGELVIAETMVAQSEELRGAMTPALARQLSHLEKITRELQEMATSLRMVPVRATFQKMARLVRDLAKKTGKAVEFSMGGEDTELDKSVVDQISDPLVHMVRNAVDHGIEESAERRIAAGKPAEGHVHLSAYHEGGNIHICIQDDGRGLDAEQILKKGIERGLVRDTEALSEREIFNLIFEPGFSTAQTVTAVSGRGVGMDVVRRNIEALRGQIQIESAPGKGSTFIIQLPLTLAIIDGMVVRTGPERHIIPTLSIVLSLRPCATDVCTVSGKGEMLRLHGELLPLFRLHRLFDISGAIEDYTEATVVVVEKNGKKSGILIDEILGQQQIVIKSLGEALRGIQGVAGGAIMPDGKVGLILDIGGLVKLALAAQTIPTIAPSQANHNERKPS